MSWTDKIQNQLIITTGDSEKFRPSGWLNASIQVEYNVAQFNFPNLPGTLVKRGERKGLVYQLEIYFQGENHLDTAELFRESAHDKRPWTIEHPYYGQLVVQPLSLLYDNTGHNVSKVTGTMVETIVEDAPRVQNDPIDTIKIQKIAIDSAFENAMTANFQPADITSLSEKQKRNFRLAIPAIKIPAQVQEYTNLFNSANSAVTNAIQAPLTAINLAIALISYPALLSQSVQSKVNLLKNQFQTLRNNIDGMFTVSSKQVYQNTGGSAIAAMAVAAISPITGDYKNSTDAFNMMDLLLENYNQFLLDMDDLQSENGGSPDSFVPDATALIALNTIMNLTISNLYAIALSSRKERSIITETDTNIILLAQRFYGLDPSDKNIDELLENNKIGLNQLLQIKKGTKIVYYI